MRARAAAAALLLLLATSALACGRAEGDGARPITVVVSPHPDDEIQAWGALGEDRRAGDVLLVFLTKGERTAYCAPELPGLDAAAGERPPEPTPPAPGTDECKAARVASTVRFLARMHEADPAFPRAELAATTTPYGVDVHRGHHDVPVLFFDLGDRALTPDAVRDAIDLVAARPDELGLPPDRPFGDLIGASYANTDDPSCFPYDHPDHLAVADVVLGEDLESFRSQLLAVCASHDGAERRPVDEAVFDAAFAVDGDRRVGAHTVEYGWLLDPYWVGDRDGQSQLFHRDQWFARAAR